MGTLRFVHAADLHLDSPFQGIRHSAPDNVAAELREATFGAYERVIDLCIEEDVQALLIAGDVFDSADRSLSAQLRFVDGLRRLDRAGIQSFVCHGNHDPLDGWTAELAFPGSCHRFGAEIGSAPIGDLATVYGISYPKRNVVHDLTPHFQRGADDRFAIGLLHANIDGSTGHESYAPGTLDSLRRSGMDYWALGHVHGHAILNPMAPAVVYPGNTQGRHPNESGPRGVCLVEVDSSKRPRIDFVPVCAVRWESARVDISEIPTEQALIDALERTATQLVDEADGCSVVCRVTIEGRGPLHATLRREATLESLREQVNRLLSRRDPFLWCERLIDRTGPDIDRDARSQADDFLGDVLRMIDDLRSDPDELAELIESTTSTLFDHHRARGYLRDFTPDRERLLADAENSILTHLLEK